MFMDFLEVIKSRRSIRKYKPNTAVTREQLDKLLEAAMHAPSACNSRPWKFVVVTGRGKLNELAEAHAYAKMLTTAGAAIIVCALPEAQPGAAEGFFPQDCAAATQNILLQAASMGLGACWCGVYPKQGLVGQLRGLLNLPDNILPFNIIAVGVPDEAPGARGSYEPERVMYIEE